MKIIFNSDLYAYIHNYKKDLINYLIDNDIEPHPNAIEDAATDFLNSDYNDLISCLKEYDNKNNYDYILVCGCLGLWYGDKLIKARLNSLETAILKCCCYDSYMIYFDSVKNTLKIDSYHHDGCNRFKIYVVKNNKKQAIKLNDLLSCY